MDEIAQAQVDLGRALSRARGGEDRALAGRVREEGERLANLLNGVLGMARLHSLDNHAFDQPLADLAAVLASLADLLGAVRLLSVEDQIYVNDIRIRLERSEAAQLLGEHFKQHQIGGLTCHATLSDASLRVLVALLAAKPPAEHPREALSASLVAKGLDAIELMSIHRFRLTGDNELVDRDAQVVASHAAVLIEEACENLGVGRIPNPLPFRRVVTEILEESPAREDFWQDPQNTNPYTVHTLRVCKLALLLGHALGLSEAALQDLGVAAMYHDVGYAARHDAGQGDAGIDFTRHSAASARMIVRQRGFHEAKIRRLLAALDHHRRYDDERGRPSLFGRILAIGEDYDILTRRATPPVAPDAALRRMQAQSGAVYDPVLLQVFINTLGRYPLDTRVQLSDGRAGVVVAPARDEAHFDKPHVHVRDASTGADTIIDLALPGAPCVVRVVSLESAAPPEGAASAPGAHAIADAPPSSAALPDKLKPANESAPPVFTSEPTSPVSPSLLSFAEAPTAPLKRMTVQSPKTLASISKDPQPLYQGVFPEVLRKLYVGRKTGQLKLSRQREERTLRFWKGNMIHAYSNQSDEQLGEIAVREGLISDFDLACVNDALARADKRVSRVLCELGLLSEKKVEDLLAIQAREVILKVFPWTDGHYIFEEQEPDASWFEELAMKLATPDLILEAVRRIDDPDVVRYQLGNIDRTLHLTTQERLKSLTVNLTALDGYVLSRVDGRLSARQVIEMIPHPPADAQRSLFGLLSIGLIEFTHP